MSQEIRAGKLERMLKKGRIRREEREREQEKAYVKRRISSEKQREKEIQRPPKID